MVSNPQLQKNMEAYITKFKGESPDVEMTRKFQDKIIYAAVLLIESMKDSVTSTKLKQGFVRTGQHVEHTSANQETTSYELMMKCTNATGLSETDYAKMATLRPLARLKVLEVGEFTG